MATVTKSIGTSSRDYSTITAWEADLDDTNIYTSGDDAVGECYNDSAFSISSMTTIDTSGGLSSITITTPLTERHDGTAGTGAKLTNTGVSHGNATFFEFADPNIRFEYMEFEFDDWAGYDGAGLWTRIGKNTTNIDINGCLFHSLENGSVAPALGIYINSNTPDVRVHNNVFITMGYCIRSSYGGTSYFYNNTGYGSSITNRSRVGIDYVNFSTNVDIRSNIMANFGTADIDTGWTISPTTNATSDSSGQTTGITASNHFVSIVGGSEDLHLLATSSLRGAGQDLGSTYAIDIDGSNRDALTGTTWDIGADQYAITASIGTSSRDYSTITLWEADLDDTTIYGAGANAVGECYNDSTFVEGFVINGGATVALNSILLIPATGERHDGTADTGVKVQTLSYGAGSQYSLSSTTPVLELRYIEIERDVHSEQGLLSITNNNVFNAGILRTSTGAPNRDMVGMGFSTGYLYNSILYGVTGKGVAFQALYSATPEVINNTIIAQSSYCIYARDKANNQANAKVKNNILIANGSSVAVDPGGTVPTSFPDYANNITNYSSFPNGLANLSDHVTRLPVSKQFVSTVSGSEDFHLIFKSAAIDAGEDIVATRSSTTNSYYLENTQYDIDGKDRDTENSIWDIGAHEFGDNVVYGLFTV